MKKPKVSLGGRKLENFKFCDVKALKILTRRAKIDCNIRKSISQCSNFPYDGWTKVDQGGPRRRLCARFENNLNVDVWNI